LVKSEIVKQLHQKHPALKKFQISTIVDIIFNTIEGSLIKKNPIELRDFGRFSIRMIKAKYNSRNPKTGEIIYVPKKKKISFKMSKSLKQKINKI